MTDEEQPATVPTFPIKTIRYAIAAMLLVLCGAAYLTYKIAHDVRDVVRSQVEIQSGLERVEHHGAILRLSIREVVMNGDMAAVTRYGAVRAQLQDELNALRQDLRLEANKATAANVDRDNLDLIALEQQALDLAGNGDLGSARRVVTSARYNRLLGSYRSGIGQIRHRAQAYLASTDQTLDRLLYGHVALTLTAFGLVFFGWIALVGPARRWGSEVNMAREAAEDNARQLQESQAELAELNGKLFEQARIDDLTRLATRRKFYEDVEHLWPRMKRYAERSCAVMCDIDHFKQYNDTYGHVEGDRALKRVADALASACRGGDRVYRMGGEEFVILQSHCSLEEGLLAADRYRLAVEAMGIPHSESRFGVVTVSMGIAALDAEAGASVEAWLGRADAALYDAKRSGRNRVAADRGKACVSG